MNRQLWISCILIVVSVLVIFGSRAWQARGRSSVDPVQQLQEELRTASNPIGTMQSAPREVTGLALIAMGKIAPTGRDAVNVAVLEAYASFADQSEGALVHSRAAVFAAGQASTLVPKDSEAAARLRGVLLKASQHALPRMRSTFLSACRDIPQLLDDAEVRAAVTRLAASNEPTLGIAERARELLDSVKTENSAVKESPHGAGGTGHAPTVSPPAAESPGTGR